MKALYVSEIPPSTGGAGGYRFQQLAQSFTPSTLEFAFPNGGEDWKGFHTHPLRTKRCKELFRKFDRVILQCGPVPHLALICRSLGIPVEVDIFNLSHLENREVAKTLGGLGNWWLSTATTGLIRTLLAMTDQAWVSNPRQADYAQHIRHTIQAHLWPLRIPDPPAEQTICPPENEELRNAVLTGKVFVSGGGAWPWFDHNTLWNAVRIAAKEEPDLRIICYPGSHVFPSHGEHIQTTIAQDPILNAHVMAVSQWLKPENHSWILRHAIAGLNVQPDTEETHRAHRTRCIDYLQHGLPVLSTEGDHIGSVARDARAGLLHSIGNAQQLAEHMLQLIREPKLAVQMGCAAKELSLRLQPSPSLPPPPKPNRSRPRPWLRTLFWLGIRRLGPQSLSV